MRNEWSRLSRVGKGKGVPELVLGTRAGVVWGFPRRRGAGRGHSRLPGAAGAEAP